MYSKTDTCIMATQEKQVAMHGRPVTSGSSTLFTQESNTVGVEMIHRSKIRDWKCSCSTSYQLVSMPTRADHIFTESEKKKKDSSQLTCTVDILIAKTVWYCLHHVNLGYKDQLNHSFSFCFGYIKRMHVAITMLAWHMQLMTTSVKDILHNLLDLAPTVIKKL